MNVSLGDLIGLEGAYVGSLDDYERALFDRAVDIGMARWSYEGGGLLGLAKVRLCGDASSPATAQPHRLADPINTEGK